MVLSGTAVDAVAAERAMAIATGSVPKGGVVVNAMNVAGPQQVMLEVRFLEVARTAGRDLGVNLLCRQCERHERREYGAWCGGASRHRRAEQPIGGVNPADCWCSSDG